MKLGTPCCQSQEDNKNVIKSRGHGARFHGAMLLDIKAPLNEQPHAARTTDSVARARSQVSQLKCIKTKTIR